MRAVAEAVVRVVSPVTVRVDAVVVASVVVPPTVRPPVAVKYERRDPPFPRSSRRLVDPCPAPA